MTKEEEIFNNIIQAYDIQILKTLKTKLKIDNKFFIKISLAQFLQNKILTEKEKKFYIYIFLRYTNLTKEELTKIFNLSKKELNEINFILTKLCELTKEFEDNKKFKINLDENEVLLENIELRILQLQNYFKFKN
jgi:K+/H+ antiporter YhaU regulatory subunit KhtT